MHSAEEAVRSCFLLAVSHNCLENALKQSTQQHFLILHFSRFGIFTREKLPKCGNGEVHRIALMLQNILGHLAEMIIQCDYWGNYL
jgi:hypothetical protein